MEEEGSGEKGGDKLRYGFLPGAQQVGKALPAYRSPVVPNPQPSPTPETEDSTEKIRAVMTENARLKELNSTLLQKLEGSYGQLLTWSNSSEDLKKEIAAIEASNAALEKQIEEQQRVNHSLRTGMQ